MKNKSELNYRPLPEFLTIGKSKIEGLGLIAKRNIKKGTDLGISHVYDKRFPDNYIRLSLGGFINHHEIPNCKAFFSKEDSKLGQVNHIRLITIKPVKKGEELTVSYIINVLKNPNWEFEYEVSQ